MSCNIHDCAFPGMCEAEADLDLNTEAFGVARVKPMPGDSPERLADCIESMASCVAGTMGQTTYYCDERDFLCDMHLIADEIRRLGKAVSR